MRGKLTLESLTKLVEAGEVDTVVVAMVDMQGRLMGKRVTGHFFLSSIVEETHGCDYLLTIDMENEPVPGYEAANWDLGYGDFTFKPDLNTLRSHPLAGRHGPGALRPAGPPEPPGHPPLAARHPEEAAGPPGRQGLGRQDGLGTGVLSLRRALRSGPRKGLQGPQACRLVHRGLPHLPDHQGRELHPRGAQRHGRGRYPGRGLQGRMGTRPGRDQPGLRRGPGDGRPPRDLQERRQGDRLPARQGHHLHGQVRLRPGRQLLPPAFLPVGRQERPAALCRQGRPSWASRSSSNTTWPACWPAPRP